MKMKIGKKIKQNPMFTTLTLTSLELGESSLLSKSNTRKIPLR